jgi:hypothetical protein
MRRFRLWLILLALSSVFYFVKGEDTVSHPATSESIVDQDIITPGNLERWYALMEQKFTQQVSLPPKGYTNYAINERLKPYPELQKATAKRLSTDCWSGKRRELDVDDANAIPSTSTLTEIMVNMKWSWESSTMICGVFWVSCLRCSAED